MSVNIWALSACSPDRHGVEIFNYLLADSNYLMTDRLLKRQNILIIAAIRLLTIENDDLNFNLLSYRNGEGTLGCNIENVLSILKESGSLWSISYD